MGIIAKAGTQVIVPYREEDSKRHLKVMGDLGQILPLVRQLLASVFLCIDRIQEWDIRNEKQIAECVRHSDIVYNLVGSNFETK